MSVDGEILTQRARLVLLGPETLELLLRADPSTASSAQGIEFPREFMDSINEVFLTRQLEAIAKSLATPGWSVRAIISKADDRVIGHCGFHGAPQHVGRAEIGYTIFEPYRRQGYATEVASALVSWAHDHGSPVVVAVVSSRNIASLGVVKKVGFVRAANQGSAEGDDVVFEVRR